MSMVCRACAQTVSTSLNAQKLSDVPELCILCAIRLCRSIEDGKVPLSKSHEYYYGYLQALHVIEKLAEDEREVK